MPQRPRAKPNHTPHTGADCGVTGTEQRSAPSIRVIRVRSLKMLNGAVSGEAYSTATGYPTAGRNVQLGVYAYGLLYCYWGVTGTR